MSAPLDPDSLRALLELEVAGTLRALQGRETFLHRDAEGRALVVKRSRPGARPGGRREHDLLVRLGDAGFPVPRALGFAEGERGSVVAMERIAHREDLRSALASRPPAGRRLLLERAADLVASLHARGWHHRDLYSQHLLLREPDGALVLIDVGRARRRRFVRARWFVKDLAALFHSLPPEVGARERLRCLARYLDRRGIAERRTRRAWVAAVRRKQRRIAGHVPHDERAVRA